MNSVPSRTTVAARDQGAESLPATHTTFRIDPAASRIEFSIGKRLFFIKHLVITGRFTDIDGTITLDERQPTSAQATITIGAASINTHNARRDTHLRAADFFHVDQYPTLTFQSRKVEAIDQEAGRYRVVGDLTVRGVTLRVSLDARYVPAEHTGASRRLKLTLTAPLNRRDFGIVWNKAAINVADVLTVNLEVEATAG